MKNIISKYDKGVFYKVNSSYGANKYFENFVQAVPNTYKDDLSKKFNKTEFNNSVIENMKNLCI